MNIKGNLRAITEFSVGMTVITMLALAGCGGSSGGTTTAVGALVSTFAGTSGLHGFTDGTGTDARFQAPSYIASDGTNLYVTDQLANNVRKIVIATGVATTFAGSTTGASGVADAPTGPGTNALFNGPAGITTDGTNLYVADSHSHTIRQIVIATGAVTTLAGSAGAPGTTDGPAATARFFSPFGITQIGSAVYVTDFSMSTVRKIDLSASAVVSTVAGTAGNHGYNDSLTGASAVFYIPTGLTTDGTSVFLTDIVNNNVRKIDPATGATTTVAGGNYASPASGVGSTDGTGTAARFNQPWGIGSDGANLYVVDTFNHTIRKIVISSGAVTTLAGTAGAMGTTDENGAAARFRYPEGVVYVNGALYVTDFSNGSIRKIQL